MICVRPWLREGFEVIRPPPGSDSKKKQKCSRSGSKVWLSRCSPSHLMQATRNFTPEQCDLIIRNGFGGLLSLKCRNPPHMLYHWLGNHFNCATSELMFSNGTIIPVTAKSVQLILGIPHGSRKVKYKTDADSVTFMKHEYCYDGLPPKIYSIAKELSGMKKADDRFLRTFLLLAVSCFLCPTTSFRVSPRCFPSLVDISCVAELDWCSFVLEQLVSSIKRYKHRLSIGGCLIFLAVHYLDHLDTGSYRVPDSIPRIGVWTTKVIEEVVNMDTVSEADGIYGQRPVKAIANNTYINLGLKFPPIIGEGLTVEQFVSSHLAADCDPSVKDELCRVVNNFCTNSASLLSMFIGSFLRDLSGLIPSSSNNSPRVHQKPSRSGPRGTHSTLEGEGADEYNTEDETSVEDASVSDDSSEDESDDANSSSESHSDDVSNHDDASEESDDKNASLDASGNELVHKKDGNKVCKQEVSGELIPDAVVPSGYLDIPRIKQEPESPASDRNLHQYTSKKLVAVPSGNGQQRQHE